MERESFEEERLLDEAESHDTSTILPDRYGSLFMQQTEHKVDISQIMRLVANMEPSDTKEIPEVYARWLIDLPEPLAWTLEGLPLSMKAAAHILMDQNPPPIQSLEHSEGLGRAVWLFTKRDWKPMYQILETLPNDPYALMLRSLALANGMGCQKSEPNASLALSDSLPAAMRLLEDPFLEKPVVCAKVATAIGLYRLYLSLRLGGLGMPKAKGISVICLGASAILGNPDSQLQLGYQYLKGSPLKSSKFQAARWLRYAHHNGRPVPGETWIFKDKWK
jgi:hypothetical protein